MTLKAGTRIEALGCPAMSVAAETARIGHWIEKVSGPRMPGWHIVKFDCDGGELCVHESRFRVIDK